MQQLRWCLGSALLVLAACGPSINQRAKAYVDTWKAKLQPADASYAEQPLELERWSLKPGAWVQYLVTQEKQGPAQLTYKVLEAEGDDVWLEIERWDYTAHSILKMLLPATVSLAAQRSWVPKRVISQQGDEPPQEMPPFLLEMMTKPMLGTVRVDWSDAGVSESMAVLAGRFSGARRVRSKTRSAFGTFETEAWGHGAVPVTGLVKSISSDGTYALELVAFGTSGASTALEGTPLPVAGF